MTTDYAAFIESKRRRHAPAGFQPFGMNPNMYPFQKHVVERACRMGKFAVFADCGLGKTLMELEWARQVAEHTDGKVLILAPLAVSLQTVREGARFGIPVNAARSMADATGPITITNYEMLHHFDASAFAGVVLDESGILKSYSGKTRNAIIGAFSRTPYRLACTATPSPNDHMELGNHAEFLGVMTRVEMLAKYFNHDGGETSKWRLKGHAVRPFWDFMASFSTMFSNPSEIGFPMAGYDLPPINRHYHTVETPPQEGFLFPVEAADLSDRRESRTESIEERTAICASLASDGNQWLVWGNLNKETESVSDAVPDSVEVSGSDTIEHKEWAMLGFSDKSVRVLVTKPKIAGHGMNWQNCSRMVFMGISDSFEETYQAERRCWRYGQSDKVDVHYLISDRDGAVVRNIDRKRQQSEEMRMEMLEGMRRSS